MKRKAVVSLTVIAAIVVAVIFAGCITLDTSPSGVVETFATCHRDGDFEACYFLMFTEYKNLTDEKAFRNEIKRCNDYYLIKVKSEKIDDDTASVEIEYAKRSLHNSMPYRKIAGLWDSEYSEKNKTIKLVKEEEGWKLTELHCELKSK